MNSLSEGMKHLIRRDERNVVSSLTNRLIYQHVFANSPMLAATFMCFDSN